jgi:hypothetical protein
MITLEEQVHEMMDRWNYNWEVFDKELGNGLSMRSDFEDCVIKLVEKYKPVINQDVVFECRTLLSELSEQIEKLSGTPEEGDDQWESI